ncbi:MAG TPA: TIGR03557 family F420-dependent LLM class oxidoreductase [Mycobacteriales bacterium]|nr:TIGR03557 family F420-dependent LLM class oxidoreductase [Mycobacteriales bacterium]
MAGQIGFTLMTEQSGPRELVRYARLAEESGFDYLVSSDHYFPWLPEMGHSPYAWSLLGAVSQVTERVGLMTYVTCPTMRYHPAVVAQKAATVGLLSEGRFVLGLGAGENLNEHVVGPGWPRVSTRHEMLAEAIDVIRRLLDGETVTHHGDHFTVDAARLWDRPEGRLKVGVAVSGDRSVDRFGSAADHLIAVQPDAGLVQRWREQREQASLPAGRAIGQLPICWGPDADRCAQRAHELFRWFSSGWPVMAELPLPGSFTAASESVTVDEVAQGIPCGPDLDAVVEALEPWWDAGFTDVALVQVGDESQEQFLREAAPELLGRVRERPTFRAVA